MNKRLCLRIHWSQNHLTSGFYGYNSINSTKTFDKWHNIFCYFLTVDASSKIPKLYGMEKITTEEVMYKMDMFQSRIGKIDESGWWDWERNSADAGKQFTSAEFKEEWWTRGVHFTLADQEHQEMNEQVEVTWRTLCTIVHHFLLHATVLEAYINFALMYMTDHIVPVLPIK